MLPTSCPNLAVPLRSPRALGKAGGVASVRSRLGIDPEIADGRLRRKAKARLEALLDSGDEAKALAAARSLYSYSPSRAPADEDEPAAAYTVSALKVILRKLDPLSTDQARTLLDQDCFNRLNRIGRRDGELERAFERFTAQRAEVAARKRHLSPET